MSTIKAMNEFGRRIRKTFGITQKREQWFSKDYTKITHRVGK